MRTIIGVLLLCPLLLAQETRTQMLSNGMKVIVQEDHAIANVAKEPIPPAISRLTEHADKQGCCTGCRSRSIVALKRCPRLAEAVLKTAEHLVNPHGGQ